MNLVHVTHVVHPSGYQHTKMYDQDALHPRWLENKMDGKGKKKKSMSVRRKHDSKSCFWANDQRQDDGGRYASIVHQRLLRTGAVLDPVQSVKTSDQGLVLTLGVKLTTASTATAATSTTATPATTTTSTAVAGHFMKLGVNLLLGLSEYAD